MTIALGLLALAVTILTLKVRAQGKLLDQLFIASRNASEILANEQDRQNNMITHVDTRVSENVLDISNLSKRMDTVEFYQMELENAAVLKPIKKVKKKAR